MKFTGIYIYVYTYIDNDVVVVSRIFIAQEFVEEVCVGWV